MEEIDEVLKVLYKKIENSYSIYSNFKVAAAVLGENNKWYYGVNVENRSYGLTICAERAAAVTAISDGVKLLKKVVVISYGKNLITPCGACREFLAEFSNEKTEILLGSENGIEYQGSFIELLPKRFILDGV